jgi:sortase A
MNKRKKISLFAIIIGCIFLLYPLFSQWQVNQTQDKAKEEWKMLNQVYAETLKDDNIKENDTLLSKVEQKDSEHKQEKKLNIEEQDREESIQSLRQDVEKHQVLGQLSIPRIELDVMVVPGVEESDIKHAVGWMTSTGFPGEEGNVVLAGHRSHTYGKFFHRLGEMEIGDQMSLDTHFGHFTYQIVEIKVVEPTDLSVLEQTDRSLLTLITCEPLYSNDYRLIVIAEELESTGRSVSYR